ncbi:hypothetical protein SNEBB_002522 [Seison nebaliae]|nr:hypothetical protein SNEBB_002522 [Seison nebaliae]
MSDIDKREVITGLPKWPENIGPESQLYQKIVKKAQYPPILQQSSWTIASPYKEQAFFHRPTEAIANNYSPAANHLRLKELLVKQQEQNHQRKLNKMSEFLDKQLKEADQNRKSGSKRTAANNLEEKLLEFALPESRPMSPTNQREMMTLIETEMLEKMQEPTPSDIKRYEHYVAHGVARDRIAPQGTETLINVQKLFPPIIRERLARSDKAITNIFSQLKEEEAEVYYISLQKAIVDYILIDPTEKGRLNINSTPRDYSIKTIRAPVAWHKRYKQGKSSLQLRLHNSNPIVLTIRRMWNEKYSQLRFISKKQLLNFKLPLKPMAFESMLIEECGKILKILNEDWVPYCSNLITTETAHWAYMVPQEEIASSSDLDRVRQFFASVYSLMSKQIRDCVIQSIVELTEFLQTYEEGNDFEESTDEVKYRQVPALSLMVRIDEETINYRPHEYELEEILVRCYKEILDSGAKVIRVETVLFPDMKMASDTVLRVNMSEEFISECVTTANKILTKNIVGPKKFLHRYSKYESLINNKSDEELNAYLKEPHELFELRDKLNEMNEVYEDIMWKEGNVVLGLFQVNVTEITKTLADMQDRLKQKVLKFVVDNHRELNRVLCRTYEEMRAKVNKIPENTEELVELINYANESMDTTIYKLSQAVTDSADRLMFLLDYAFFSAEDMLLNNNVFHWPDMIFTVLERNQTRLSTLREKVEDGMKERVEKFQNNLETYQSEVELYRKKDNAASDEIKANVEALGELGKLLNEAVEEMENINKEETLLGWEETSYPLLRTIISQKEPYDKLWNTINNFLRDHERWMNGPITNIQADLVEDDVLTSWRTLHKLTKEFADQGGPRRIAEQFKTKLDRFKQNLPLLKVISNPGLKKRHWDKFIELTGIDIPLTDESNLFQMIELGLGKHLDKIEDVAGAASKEHSLEKALNKMRDEWKQVEFIFTTYRDTNVNILSSVDEIQLLLDDHVIKAQTMLGSPFVGPLEDQMKAWWERLVSIQDILDAWLKVQATWLYLEPIFSSEDIIAQMPEEGRKFATVDGYWKDIMSQATKNTLVLAATSQPGMLAKLRESNNLLEDIQQGLNDYLEKKRLYFPRFFFLSNDELLEILSETKDPTRVQPHLKKCFEGIHRLNFNEQQEITEMISSEGEHVELKGTIVPSLAKGMVEKWLLQVEHQMISSLSKIIMEAQENYGESPREKWVKEWAGQVILCVSQIFWTAEVTEAIISTNLSYYLKQCNQQIDEIVQLVRGKLVSGTRITLGALIVIDVHARDVVEKMTELGISEMNDFTWLSQLRYYIDEKSVNVEMITTQLAYGYEYLGNSSRLVITPLTDRCYRTLMGALKLNLGGAPEGPAGTGKTETSKDLAKAVAKQCVVFNCSDGLDYKAMSKFFKGLAQAGAWACFDEFNRIELEVLSVVAQQILTIQRAVAANMPKFIFEGTELTLDPTCTIFITMNPGYAGRSELPDNLKVLFRTVAMMVPDYAMIGEISLYSMGFIDARSLAVKIVATYRLCSEQLSSQHHYDYGMRAVKSVLTASGNLKLKFPEENESILVLRAIKDVNLPKFLAQDVPLFQGIISDLFPGVILPESDYSKLIDHLNMSMKKRNLTSTNFVIDKIIQVYEMMLVRHGFMIVGDPLGGKSSSYKVLADALGSLERSNEMDEHNVIYKVINPKSITMGQLYGQFDNVSHEWSDGVLANTFREFATNTSEDRKWIIFDGPVDAVWIENMNTVLDDNKKLCLMSGEIIQMSNSMNLIFEPADLEQASPATVSRCGMIYMDPKQLGWRPFKDSFINEMPDLVFQPQHIELIETLFEWLVDPCLLFIRKECQQLLETSDIHLVKMMMTLMKCMMDEFYEEQATLMKTTKNSVKENRPTSEFETSITPTQIFLWIQGIFLFSVVWGIGATLDGQSRKKFDEYLRNILMNQNTDHPKPNVVKLSKSNIFPDRSDVYSFLFRKVSAGHWDSWTELIDRERNKLDPDKKISDAIVTTTETVRQEFFIQLFMEHQIPTMFLGATGTGKSLIIGNSLLNLDSTKYLPNTVNFSAQTNSNLTMDIIMSKLDRRRKGVYGPPPGKLAVAFVDDLNMPMKEVYGAQPPIELLRQFLDQGHWYDRTDTSRLDIIDLIFISAMGIPGGGRNEISSRLTRHLNIMAINSFNDETMMHIFSTMIDWHYNTKGFEAAFLRLGRLMVTATLNVYKSAVENFLPTPSKSHYVFNLRDFARVIKGIILVPHTHLQDEKKGLRLWLHEIYRVFYDRLIEDDDRTMFFDIVKTITENTFKQRLDVILERLIPEKGTADDETIRTLIFGNYMTNDVLRIYDEVDDMEKLMEVMDSYLEEYNLVAKNPMNLVLFQFAIEHVSRISRILQQDNGHALLVGVGGSGRASAVKLASFMIEYDIFQIEITKNYSKNDWRDDIKRLFLKSGSEGKQTTFLFSDTQVKSESFIEDINLILNTADLPNLFPADEKAEICEKMQTVSKQEGIKIDVSPLSLYSYFISRVKRNLHVVLTFSPIGDSFRNRLRMFPALINCCTIDWFLSWPDDALEIVAKKFFDELDIEESVKESIVTMCQHFHIDVRQKSDEFLLILRRHNYVTPTSYLELIQTFKKLLGVKRKEVLMAKERYENGLEKLAFAAQEITVMQSKLQDLQPQLEKKAAETEKLMVRIEQETADVEEKKEIVAADEQVANEAAAKAQSIKDDCENDLAEALPAYNEALKALDTLKPTDIQIVKTMNRPPPGIKLVMESICVIKGVKPDRKPDPSTGRMIEEYWTPSLKMLNDTKFLESLKKYDKDNIPEPIIKRIREKFIPDPNFTPESIAKVSTACEGLCRWVRAMDKYDKVNKIVAPKKEKLAKAEAEYEEQLSLLNAKRTQLQAFIDNLAKKNDEFQATEREKKDLEEEKDLCATKLERAEKLIGGLGGEKSRWTQQAELLGQRYVTLTGDVLMSAGIVAYLGSFTVDFRQNCIDNWTRNLNEMKIPSSGERFSLNSTLGNPVEIRDWQICGLPVDAFSIDNGIIVKSSRRWPLMIDPQGQANKWVKNMEKQNRLEVIKLNEPTYSRTLENCIQFGYPCLLENVGEELDPLLEPILLKQIIKQQNVDYIKLGDNLIEYSLDFRLFITTKLRNPHYLPEVSVKVVLVNFMITPLGLQDQLLSIVAAKEKPELEKKKNQLIIESAENKKKLQEIEDKILEVLSGENILENEQAIKILSSSKILSEEITIKQQNADITQKEIDETRLGYSPVAEHSTVLFFCISQLANIDPMYQYSLVWFIRLYNLSITNSEPAAKLKTRIKILNNDFTRLIYSNICRSLFEKDKLLFSFLLNIKLQQANNVIDNSVWKFLLTGGVGLIQPKTKPKKWLTDKAWNELIRAGQLKNTSLEGIDAHFLESSTLWQAFYEAIEPENLSDKIPMMDINDLEFLVVLRCFRPDKVVPGVRNYIVKNLGKAFVDPPTFDLNASFSDSNDMTPLIFVLSPGADPMAGLLKFGESKGLTDEQIRTISLGQGQGGFAAKLIEDAQINGDWVVLQNCHLAASWMPTLERICENFSNKKNRHPDFRLWLTSYPSEQFPVSILQNGIKMTNEPPKGLRSNLLRSYLNDPISDPEFYNNCPKKKEWSVLLYALCFFHGLVQERRNFGPLGWNIPYEFNESDLRISLRQLQMFLNEYEAIPYDALLYLFGECNYGGRVTDEKDRRLLNSLLSHFICEDAIMIDDYKLSESGTYVIPSKVNHEQIIEYIRELPLITLPEVYGLHANADITKDNQETMTLFKNILTTLPRDASTGGDISDDDRVYSLAEQILNDFPNVFDLEEVCLKHPVIYEESMNTVLRQEIIRYNILIEVIRSTLANLQKAIKGLVVMSKDLEDIFNSILISAVPTVWAAKSYPSLKPLAGYLTDLIERLDFFTAWIEEGLPLDYWLSGFYFTQSFLTGVLQNYARKYQIPIDHLSFQFQILPRSSSMEEPVEDGAVIWGLFLEGARWDEIPELLAESKSKILFEKLPSIWLKPCKTGDLVKGNDYVCPVYKTSARRGTLSTTGHSTNFVFNIFLPSDQTESHWINRGVAALCQLDD